jgi:hypothetical protein
MNNAEYKPTTLWLHDTATPSVRLYISAHRGEFPTGSIESGYPYDGPASSCFRRLTRINPYECYDRFEGLGIGCWTIKRDSILNDLTADLLAAADFLQGRMKSDSVSAAPGGIGAESSKIWVSFLDGGVGVEVLLCEHERTNRVQGTQRTTIRGPKAYRALLELLGFAWINRKLEGETTAPKHEEIKDLVGKFLAHTDPI